MLKTEAWQEGFLTPAFPTQRQRGSASFLFTVRSPGRRDDCNALKTELWTEDRMSGVGLVWNDFTLCAHIAGGPCNHTRQKLCGRVGQTPPGAMGTHTA